MDKEKESKPVMQILKYAYLFLYLINVYALYLWNGGIYIFISIFLFGLPLLIFLIPLLGLKMFSSANKVWIGAGYLSSFVPLYFLNSALTSLPLKQQWSEAGHTSLAPEWVAPIIICSGVLFFIVSTVSFFIVCLNRQIKLK